MDDHHIRETLARGMRILANEVAPDNRGHVSYRPPGENRVYIVGRLHVLGRTMDTTTYDDVVVIDLDARPLEGRFPSPDESVMHTAVYRVRDDVRSVVHVHPPRCVALTIVGQTAVPVCQSSIAPFMDGPIPLFDKAGLINTPGLADEMAAALGQSKALLLRGHGALVTGRSIEDAVVATILLETSARTQFEAAQIGTPRPLEMDSPLMRDSKGNIQKPHWPYRLWAYYEEQLIRGSGPGRRQ